MQNILQEVQEMKQYWKVQENFSNQRNIYT